MQRPPVSTEKEKAEIVKEFLDEGETSGYQMKPESRVEQICPCHR